MADTRPHTVRDKNLSPQTLSSFDGTETDPRLLALQEELRNVLFVGVANPPASQHPSSPSAGLGESASKQDGFDFTQTTVPKTRIIKHLKNWISECAPHFDKFDEARHFGIHIPNIARTSPALFYAMLAFSATQSERKKHLSGTLDSLEFYQASIEFLKTELREGNATSLMTACILACLELMSGNSKNWRRHVEGCAALFEASGVNGFSGGLLQPVFWCYAHMDLCGAIIADGMKSSVLGTDKWIPKSLANSPNEIRDMFHHTSRDNPDMHANWVVYLCAKACDLACGRHKFLEQDQQEEAGSQPFNEQWNQLWNDLEYWAEARGPAMLPVKTKAATGQGFPEILYAHHAAISANQLRHAASIIMLEIQPQDRAGLCSEPHWSALWHARHICGISLTNSHAGSLVNAIQPLFLAGRLFTHPKEHFTIGKLLKFIEDTTGWGTLWRVADLEQAWGYRRGDILSCI
ncbi:transcriptional regulator family: Fungal Specific TF [Trichoderma aggressivum f. europaeum]|uniref:Transcriptional regulator family: Fungal Specific TF n=1 Tax=Trichoderma aggressivum f. europaeum TaxID=173218 RepID=A0AAE1ILS9_9HYPO|nr:transcriptional regulator family: Fungal Specific TF [Trichoderma aggressivum f. europaeum]